MTDRAVTDNPVTVTADPDIRAAVDRWCAALGAVPDTVTSTSAARARWRSAPLVLVGADLVDPLAAGGLPRRDHLVVVAPGTADPSTRPALWRAAVELGAAAVVGTDDETLAVEVMGRALDGRGEAALVAVVGAGGGVGASTLAVGLAQRAAHREWRALVLDLDPLAGGLDLVLGAEQATGVRWPDLRHTGEGLGAATVAEVLPVHRGVAVLTGDRERPGGLPDPTPILGAAVRAYDLVVADVPRLRDSAAAGVLARAAVTVVVVADDVRGVAAAQSVAEGLGPVTASLVLVVRRRRGGVGTAEVGRVLELPVAATLRTDRGLQATVDRGHGPATSRSVRRAADALLDLVGLGSAGLGSGGLGS